MCIKGSFASVFLIMFLLVWVAEGERKIKVFNVKDYGAIADGKTDNSKAFLKAWSEACKWDGKGRVLIPEGTFMLNSVIFDGPCKGWMAFVIKGVLKAPTDLSLLLPDKWINFRYVDQLSVSGGGKLDAQGASAWPLNVCRKNLNCPPFPTTMRFDFVTNGRVHHIQSIDSKSNHFTVFGCENMNFTKVRISASGNSPNTDGIKIGSSYGINITRVVIGTGDDCVAMISGAKKIRISEVICGPGHGISVGSLGKVDAEEDVQDIVVKNCTFHNTSDGVRIKTWPAPLTQPLEASNFVYEDILMDNVQHPIIIDQQYCPYPPCNTQVASHVQISNVKYKNIRGSCSTDFAVTLRCSEEKPCQNITMENIDLWRHDAAGKVSSWCSHVNGASRGKQRPPSCI